MTAKPSPNPAENPQDDQSVQPVAEVRLKPMSGPSVIMDKMARKLRGAAGVAVVSGALGSAAGMAAQDKYRDTTGYDPHEQFLEDDNAEEDRDAPDAPKNNGLLDRAKRRLKQAKDWAVDNTIEKLELVKKYRELQRELFELKQGLLRTGDIAAFWLPFLLTFLASAMVLNAISRRYLELSQVADPVVVENMKRLQEAANETIRATNAMIERVNHLRQTVSFSTPETAALAAAQADSLLSELETTEERAQNAQLLEREGTRQS